MQEEEVNGKISLEEECRSGPTGTPGERVSLVAHGGSNPPSSAINFQNKSLDRKKSCPRSLMDRAPASGAGNASSSLAGDTSFY